MSNIARLCRLRLVPFVIRLRNRHLFALDLLAFCLLPALALTLRLDGLGWWPKYAAPLFLYTLAALALKVYTFYKLDIYRRYWRYANVDDLTLILSGVVIATVLQNLLCVLAYAIPVARPWLLPRSVPLLDGLLTCLVASGLRVGVRGLYHWQHQRRGGVGGRRVLIVGAGEAGTLAVKEMRANPALDMEPVGFVDDANAKVGAQICGLPVLGRCSQIPQLVAAHDIQRIVITMPSTPYPRQQEIIALCEETGVATHALPGVYEILAGHKTVDQLPRVDINLLLHRTTVETDQVQVAARLKGMRVLVTGAGGSIGGELCRQIARFKPEQILLLGHGENSIFEIGLDLRLSFPNLATRPVIADVRDAERIDWVVQHYRPDIIFHAAAHKHVPFMEGCVHEAIANNVLGTRNVVHAAERYAVERLIMISTDKAVNPASVMGASKRLAELFVLSAACRSGRAYMAVRFGNVLGSRGSVVPVFQRQIAAGGPVTVTHPQMRRYFMTIPEAVQLVLQASHLGQGGEIFVLDMGQQVRIVDLANDLIKLSGLVPGRDIRVIYTGVRPGEKLFEELFLEQEEYERTRHARIFVARSESQVSTDLLEPLVVELVGLSKRMQSQGDADLMRVLLPQVCRYIDGSWRRPAPVVAGPVTRLESPQPEAVITRPALSST